MMIIGCMAMANRAKRNNCKLLLHIYKRENRRTKQKTDYFLWTMFARQCYWIMHETRQMSCSIIGSLMSLFSKNPLRIVNIYNTLFCNVLLCSFGMNQSILWFAQKNDWKKKTQKLIFFCRCPRFFVIVSSTCELW